MINEPQFFVVTTASQCVVYGRVLGETARLTSRGLRKFLKKISLHTHSHMARRRVKFGFLTQDKEAKIIQ